MGGGAENESSSSIKLLTSTEKKTRWPQAQHDGEFDNILSSPSELNDKSRLDLTGNKSALLQSIPQQSASPTEKLPMRRANDK